MGNSADTVRAESRYSREIQSIKSEMMLILSNISDRYHIYFQEQERMWNHMQEYRRFVAYFYEYIDGKKQKNVGFAKVELRNGGWRILFRLTAHVHPRPPVEVSGFVREGKHLLMFPMGTMRAGREMMEEWAYRAGEVLWMEKYRMEDLSGIFIQSGDDRSFITVWDDEPFSPEQLVRELPEEKPELNETKEEAPGSPEQTMQWDGGIRIADTEKTDGSDHGAKAAVEETEVAAYSIELQETQNTAEPSEKPQKEYNAGLRLDSSAEQQEESSMKETDTEGENTIGINAEKISTDEENAQKFLNSSDQMIAPGTNKTGERGGDSPEAAVLKTETDDQREMELLCEDLYRNRVQFQPFMDTEISRCIRIMPCDVARLQRARCRTGRNSFLLHGFHNYRHLMLGITEEGNYVLGVPGIMDPQEKYMAVMFGFPNFKYAEEEGGCQPYGYWYRILQHEGSKREE